MEGDQLHKGSDHEAADWIMETDENNNPMDLDPVDNKTVYCEMNVETLEKFCKDASRAFFNEFGLISHQINSFNQFVTIGIQELFDSLGEVVVEPGYDPSKGGGENWRHATIKYGKVSLDKPSFWPERNDQDEECLKLLPRHARLQNMTYSSKLKVEVRVQVIILSYFSIPAEIMVVAI